MSASTNRFPLCRHQFIRSRFFGAHPNRVHCRSSVVLSITAAERPATVRLFDDGHVDGVVREQDFADVAEQDVDSLFAVDFLVAVHRDHDGRVELRVVDFEGEIAGDLAVVADPPAVLLQAERIVPVVVVVAQAVPLETFGL
jgi:hypothetical protein